MDASVRTYLISWGATTDAEIAKVQTTLARTTFDMLRTPSRQELITSALTRWEVARHLQVSLFAVDELPNDRALMSFRARGGTLLPAWQFTPNHTLLPRLADLIGRIPEQTTVKTVSGVMTNARIGLGDDTQFCTPTEWLQAGGPRPNHRPLQSCRIRVTTHV